MIKPWAIFKSILIIVEVLLTLWMIVIAFNDSVEIYVLQFVSIRKCMVFVMFFAGIIY